MKNEQFIVTISHQMGSGGSVIGTKLSEQLAIPYVDRQILKQVADKLHVAESVIQNREERVASVWASFSRLADYTNMFQPPQYIPTDKELFQLESDYIKQIANQSGAVILGRGGQYALRDWSNHISVLIYADMLERVDRVKKLYRVSDEEAKRIIARNDRERANYIQTFTKQDMLDVKLYDICLNSSRIGVEHAAEIIRECVTAKSEMKQ